MSNANTNDTIWALGNNRFAIGKTNERATYVLKQDGTKFTGVRGQRPILLSGRYRVAKVTTTLRTAFKEAING